MFRNNRINMSLRPNLHLAILCALLIAMSSKTALAQAVEKSVSQKPASTAKASESKPGQSAKKDEKAQEGSEKEDKVQILTPPVPWILQPYRVQINVSFVVDPLISDSFRRTVVRELRQHLVSQFHQMWELDVQLADGDNWLTGDELQTLTSESIQDRSLASKDDKTLFLTVSHQPGEYQILGREWDASSQTLGSLHSRTIRDRREIVAALAQAVAEAFRPIAELEVVNPEGAIEFLVRGGELYPRNTEMQQFQKGDFLIPYLRYLDRKRELQKIQPLPWTYLQVDSVDRSRISLSVTSAFGNPLAAKRRRVEIHAMRVRPFLPFTEVFIYPRGERQNPLVGYRCEVMNRVPTAEDPVEDRMKLETDRRGIVTVPVNPEAPLQYLYVYSGQALLAKVPFVPGIAQRLEVEVPDDRARLNVEGEVALLQGELIDIVATREVLMARTRGAAKSKKWEDVSRFLSQLQDLPNLDDYNSRIGSLQVRAVQAAKLARDRVAEIRVKKLCDGISESAQKHLDPFRIAEFRREMDELKRNSK